MNTHSRFESVVYRAVRTTTRRIKDAQRRLAFFWRPTLCPCVRRDPIEERRAREEAFLRQRRLGEMGRRLLSVFLVCALLVPGTLVVAQPESVPEDADVRTRTVNGEIGVARFNYVSIVYDSDEETRRDYEMVLPVDDSLELANFEDLRQLKAGDEVRVTYDEYTWVTEDEREHMQRHATHIQFLNRGEQSLRSE